MHKITNPLQKVNAKFMNLFVKAISKKFSAVSMSLREKNLFHAEVAETAEI